MDSLSIIKEITNSSGELTPVGIGKLRQSIAKLEELFLKEEQADIPLKHYFSKGVYAREISISKGVILVGKIHKFQNMNIISKGEVSFLSIDGSYKVKAPHTFVASPGVKRVIYAHEDSVWTTIHGTDETDLSKIEEIFIAKDYCQIYEESQRTFKDVLMTLGISEEILWNISSNPQDQADFDKYYPVEIKESSIHGDGLFARDSFEAGDVICPARIDGLRTPAGRYSNHSGDPNGEMILMANNVYLFAKKNISIGEEILTDYYYNFINTRS